MSVPQVAIKQESTCHDVDITQNAEVCNELESEFESIVPSEENCFFFETDPPGLKNDKDYQRLLKSLAEMEACKIRSVKDLEFLVEERARILNDPLGFVRALQNGETFNFPGPRKIPEVPVIDWEKKYNLSAILQGAGPITRKSLVQTNFTEAVVDSALNEDGILSNEASSLEKGKSSDRLKSKSQTFNCPWSSEEQKKLEELLIKYPDETISSRRWRKISKELGTRTMMQVQSRVQKFFIALKKEGLPVPGKIPSTNLIRQAAKSRKRGAYYSYNSSSRSSFMKAFDFDSISNAAESVTEGGFHSTSKLVKDEFEVSDEEDIKEELRDTEEYQELLVIKRVKRLKLEEMRTGVTSHVGFECDGCGANPIIGPRWHCTECPSTASTDFCQDCVRGSFKSQSHLPSHVLKPVNCLSLKDTMAHYSQYNN